jgi:phosphocarrier protein HPr
MVSSKVTVKNPSGLHLRPAGNLCKTSLKFHSKIELVFGATVANAKSVLSVLGACVKCGDEIEVRCSGDDEQDALKAVTDLAESGFGEEE